jgi:hypothetical protein
VYHGAKHKQIQLKEKEDEAGICLYIKDGLKFSQMMFMLVLMSIYTAVRFTVPYQYHKHSCGHYTHHKIIVINLRPVHSSFTNC